MRAARLLQQARSIDAGRSPAGPSRPAYRWPAESPFPPRGLQDILMPRRAGAAPADVDSCFGCATAHLGLGHCRARPERFLPLRRSWARASACGFCDKNPRSHRPGSWSPRRHVIPSVAACSFSQF